MGICENYLGADILVCPVARSSTEICQLESYA